MLIALLYFTSLIYVDSALLNGTNFGHLSLHFMHKNVCLGSFPG